MLFYATAGSAVYCAMDFQHIYIVYTKKQRFQKDQTIPAV